MFQFGWQDRDTSDGPRDGLPHTVPHTNTTCDCSCVNPPPSLPLMITSTSSCHSSFLSLIFSSTSSPLRPHASSSLFFPRRSTSWFAQTQLIPAPKTNLRNHYRFRSHEKNILHIRIQSWASSCIHNVSGHLLMPPPSSQHVRGIFSCHTSARTSVS